MPAQTFRGTVTPLLRRGARLRFADAAPGQLNVDAETVERALTPATRAVFVVHHGGQPAPLRALRALLDARDIPLVEDCAHALGAHVDGAAIGSGALCCFSFQSLKHVSTLGEGGALLTSNDEWAEQARALRRGYFVGTAKERAGPLSGRRPPPPDVDDSADDSWIREFVNIEEVGTSARLSEVAAAAGRVQLERLDRNVARRRSVAQAYDDGLSAIEGVRPLARAAGVSSSWHLYSLLVDPAQVDRRRVLQAMSQQHRVQVVLRYFPLHLLGPLRALGHQPGEAPAAEEVFFERLIQLPIHPSMAPREVARAIDALASSVRDARR